MPTLEELIRRDKLRRQAAFLMAQQQMATAIMSGPVVSSGPTPSTIFGSDLAYWFLNSNASNITLDGTTVESQTSEVGSFIRSQATGSAKPEIANGIITYDGVGEWLNLESPASILDDEQGFCFQVWDPVDTGACYGISFADDAAVNTFILYGFATDTSEEAPNYNVAGVSNKLKWDFVYDRTTYETWMVGSDGSNYFKWVDGVALVTDGGTDNGNWCADIAALDNHTFGAINRTGPFFSAYSEKSVGYINRKPTAAEMVDFTTWAATL